MNDYVIDENDQTVIDISSDSRNIDKIILDYKDVPDDIFEFNREFIEKEGGEMNVDDVRPKSMVGNVKKIIKNVVVKENIDVTKKVLNIGKDIEGKIIGKITTVENDANRLRSSKSRDNDVVIESDNNDFEVLSQNSDDDYVYMVNINPNEVMNGMEVVIDRDALVSTNLVSNDHVVNKRLQSNDTYTIGSLMNDPENKDGLDKTSTIVVDVDTPDITQISNYSIKSNGIKTIDIPSGYDAVDSISVDVDVQPDLELWDSKTITVEDNGKTLSQLMEDSSKDGISKESIINVSNLVVNN